MAHIRKRLAFTRQHKVGKTEAKIKSELERVGFVQVPKWFSQKQAEGALSKAEDAELRELMRRGEYGNPKAIHRYYTLLSKVKDILDTSWVEELTHKATFMLAKSPPRKGDTIVDLATGTSIMPLIASRIKPGNYIGIDENPGMLDQSKKNLAKFDGKVHLVQADLNAKHLPLKTSSANQVWLSFLHPVTKPNFYKEINRVLKPKGTVKIVQHVNTPKEAEEVARHYRDKLKGKFDVSISTEVVQGMYLINILARKK